jgi:transposase-like protein
MSDKMVENETVDVQSFNNAADLVQLCDTITYFLHLKMATMDKNANFRVPPAVEKIIELGRQLPVPRPEEWGSLAVGRISTKRKFKASGGPGLEEIKSSKRRATWSEEAKKELVELVENEDMRIAKLGDRANHAGHINWTALARRYGFAGAGPVYRQYEAMTGKQPPGIRPKDLQKGDSMEHMWTGDKCDQLIRYVEDADFRKAMTGTESMKWKDVGDYLGFSTKECKEKYSDLTGKDPVEQGN